MEEEEGEMVTLTIDETTPVRKEEPEWVRKMAKEMDDLIWRYIRDFGDAVSGVPFEWECSISYEKIKEFV